MFNPGGVVFASKSWIQSYKMKHVLAKVEKSHFAVLSKSRLKF